MSGKANDSHKLTKQFVVLNKLGIHARPSSLFVKTATPFKSNIFVEKDGETINGKSIMGLMMLAAGPGSRITVHIEGHDAAEAMASLEDIFRRKFDEE